MTKKKVVAVILSLTVTLLVLLGIYASFALKDFWPFGKKKKTSKKGSTSKEVVSEKKIPPGLAKEIMSQQQESSYNLRQLAQGGIKSIAIDKATKHTKEVDLAITAMYVDDSTLDGEVTFWQRDGDWYLVEVARRPKLHDPPLKTGISELTENDIEIGKQLVRQQQKNQEVVLGFVQEEIKKLTINKVSGEIDSEGRDESIVDITATYRNGEEVEIVSELLRHEGFWYLMKIALK